LEKNCFDFCYEVVLKRFDLSISLVAAVGGNATSKEGLASDLDLLREGECLSTLTLIRETLVADRFKLEFRR